MNELEVDFRLKLAKSEQTLKQVESEKLLAIIKLESSEASSKMLIEKLQNDKIKLELNIIQLENQLRVTHREMETKESEFKKESQELLAKHQTLLHASNSSSSLSSMGANTPVKKEHQLEDTLVSHLKTQLDCLSKIYSCLDEQKSGQACRQAVKCEQMLTQQITASVSNKFKNFDKLVAEFCELNHSLLVAVTSDLATPIQLAKSTLG